MKMPFDHALRAHALPRPSAWVLVATLVWPLPAAAQLGPDRELTFFQLDLGELDESGDRFGDAVATGDFNGDGYADLAAGSPFEDLGGKVDAGTVLVTYGSVFGLGLGPSQTWNQDDPNLVGSAQAGDLFGSSLAAADVDGDGYDDLAIGIAGDTHGAATGAGSVLVLFGTTSGLSGVGDELWHQDSPGVTDDAEASDGFGSVLTFGDFDLDGFQDLAVGSPGEDVGPDTDAGMVTVLYGTSVGLTATGSRYFYGADAEDAFGFALAAGDVVADAAADLVVGVPGEESPGVDMDAGAARLRPGSIGVGVESPGAGFFGGAAGNAQGSSLAVGNFDGSGLAEVGVGVTGYTDSADTQGSVWIWSLDPPGLPGFFYQGQAGGLDSAEPFDRFGEVLAVGDFDGDGRDDLAIGVPGENFGDGGPSPRLDAGVVQVVYGSTLGASLAGNQLWSLDTPGIGAFNAASNDRFGDALATGDFDGDGADDLAIGIPGADVGANGSGAVQILYGNVRSLFSDGFESGDVSAWSESLSLSASHTASSASVWGPSPAAP